MKLEDKLGLCLPSQDIRELIRCGKIVCSSFDESRIQPSSFEPIIGNKVFILDTETDGLFRPNSQERVERTLLKLPKRKRPEEDISNGF